MGAEAESDIIKISGQMADDEMDVGAENDAV